MRLSSALIRSMFASLLATICSAVSCGSPSWVSTACLAPLPALPAFAVLAEPACFVPPAPFAAGAACPFFPTPSTPVKTPTTPPIAPPKHAAHGSGSLVAGLRSLLNALNHLRIDGRRRAEKHDDNGPEHEAPPQMHTRCRCRADHYLVSMVDLGLLAESFGARLRILPYPDIIVFAPRESTVPPRWL